MRRQRTIYPAIAGAIFFLFVGVGCTAGQVAKSDPDTALRKRVQEYWDLKIKREIDLMYVYEYPVYRKQVAKSQYIARHANPMMSFTSFEIIDIGREGDSAEVKVRASISVKPPGAKPLTGDRIFDERWLRVDDEWYHVPSGMKGLVRDQ